MAALHGKANQVEMKMRPYRLIEKGQPCWILTELEIKESGSVLLSTTFSLTSEDLAGLRTQLTDLAADRRDNFVLATTDGDLVFEGCRANSPGDVFLALWKGQPYEVMKGYRFLARADDLPQFANDLEYDECVALPPGRLP